MLLVELIDQRGKGALDVPVTHMLANHAAVLALDQSVVVGAPGARLGLLDEKFVEQLGDHAVDELAAVVRVEVCDNERKLRQRRFQGRLQMRLRDRFDANDDFPLSHFVDQVDVVDALLPVEIALVHRVHANVARPPARIRLAPLADGQAHAAGLAEGLRQLLVGPALAQPVDVGYGDFLQTHEALIVVDRMLSSQDRLRRRAGEASMGVVRLGQQLLVDGSVRHGETVPSRPRRAYCSSQQACRYEARELGAGEAAQPFQVGLHQALVEPVQLEVMKTLEDRFDPGVTFPSIGRLERDASRTRQDFPNLFQRRDFRVVHNDCHGPKLANGANTLRGPVQAHFA